MKRLICLVGPSASGKDAILKSALKLIPNLKQVISDTTRVMRKGESQGVQYNFISEDLMIKKNENDEYIEIREYVVSDGSVWKYGINKNELNLEDNGNYICILDFQGLREMEEYLFNNGKLGCLTSIYIDTTYHTRLIRSLNREGVMTNEQVEEVIRRFQDDLINVEPAREYCDMVLYNNTMDSLINIIQIIQETIN